MRNKKTNYVLTIAILVIGAGLFVSSKKGLTATTYTLASPVPATVDHAALQPGLSMYAAPFLMFQTLSGDYHAVTQYSVSQKAYFNDINLTNGTSKSFNVTSGQNVGRFAFDKANNVLYFSAVYSPGNNFYKYDLTAGTVSLLISATGASNNIIIGTDGLIWMACQGSGAQVMSYNPATGTLKTDWPGVDADAQYIESLGADADYIYEGNRGTEDATGRYLTVIKRSDLSVQTFDKGVGNPTSNVFIGADGKYYYFSRANGEKKFSLPPVNGSLVEVSNPGGISPDPKINCAFDGPADYNTWENVYNYRFILDKVMPMEGTQEYSELQWRTPKGSGPYTTIRIPYTGPWGDGGDGLLMSISPTKILSLGSYITEYDYVNNVRSVKGQTYFSPYGMMKYDPTGEIYLLGYSKSILRYDPTKPWTLTATTSTPYSPTDPNRPNPYNIATVDKGHYVFAGDYDASGLVWTASNYTRLGGSDYGVLTWYNPVDGTSGTIPALQNLLDPNADKIRSLVATNGRSKIAISVASNKIYIIDAATKTLERTITLAPNLFSAIIEPADDQLLVVQASVDDSSGNVSRVTKLRVSTGEIIFDKPIGVAGWAFGTQSANSKYRYAWRLKKGPDNFGWMFVGDNIYRIDPANGNFELVTTNTSGSYNLEWSKNNLDLFANGGTKNSYYPNLLTASNAFSPADLNEDSAINQTDLDILKNDFLKLTANLTKPKSDINADGQCTVKDVGIMMSGWR